MEAWVLVARSSRYARICKAQNDILSKSGIQMAGIPMTENEIELLLDVLDKDGDNEINYRYENE